MTEKHRIAEFRNNHRKKFSEYLKPLLVTSASSPFSHTIRSLNPDMSLPLLQMFRSNYYSHDEIYGISINSSDNGAFCIEPSGVVMKKIARDEWEYMGAMLRDREKSLKIGKGLDLKCTRSDMQSDIQQSFSLHPQYNPYNASIQIESVNSVLIYGISGSFYRNNVDSYQSMITVLL